MMKILHYTLGFPPDRTGGLVQYSLDLAHEQIVCGHDVTIMFPGKLTLFSNKKVYFKINKKCGIRSVEMINSLPLPLLGNIGQPKDFMKKADPKIFEKFLIRESPDVIHIHTLMGLYAEFLFVAKKMHIKLIFTTHDYFGISPNQTFFLGGHDFANDFQHDIWEYIPYFGMSTLKHRLVQLPVYSKIRPIMKYIKQLRNGNILCSNHIRSVFDVTAEVDEKYLLLKQYYLNMLGQVDYFHFNSSVSLEIYKNFLNTNYNKSEVIHITSRNIKETKYKEEASKKINTIAFIGPYTIEKGFDKYVKFANKHKNLYNFIAMGDNRHITGGNSIKNLGKFKGSALDLYTADVDLVIIPSVVHETFGLVGIESLSRNIKTVASRNVGFSDLLSDEFIFDDIFQIDIRSIEKAKIDTSQVVNMVTHTKKILDVYMKVASQRK